MDIHNGFDVPTPGAPFAVSAPEETLWLFCSFASHTSS